MILALKILGLKNWQEYLAFLEGENGKIKDMGRDICIRCANLGKVTHYEKEIVIHFLSKIILKIKKSHPKMQGALTSLSAQLGLLKHFKNREYPLYRDQLTVAPNILKNVSLPVSDPVVIFTEYNNQNFILSVQDNRKLFIANMDVLLGSASDRRKIFVGIDASDFKTPVVIKLTQLNTNSIEENGWDNERKILEKLSTIHSNILNPISFYKSNEHIVVVTPLIGFFYNNTPESVWRDTWECFKKTEQSDIKKYLAKHYFSVFVDVVKHLHANGIYHRDIKPENGFLNLYGSLRVSDFELATTKTEVCKESVLGTLGYLHPGFKDCNSNVKLDLWALGATLYTFFCAPRTLTSPEWRSLFGNQIAHVESKLNEEFLGEMPEIEKNEIKKIIRDLTISIPTDSNHDNNVLQEISKRTDAWKLEDKIVIAMLLQLSKGNKDAGPLLKSGLQPFLDKCNKKAERIRNKHLSPRIFTPQSIAKKVSSRPNGQSVAKQLSPYTVGQRSYVGRILSEQESPDALPKKHDSSNPPR